MLICFVERIKLQEIFYEESSILIDDGKATKKYYLYKILSVFSYIFLFFYILIALLLLDFSFISSGFVSILINLLIIIVPSGCFIFSGVFFGVKKNRQYVEYDYSIMVDQICISKIIKNAKRKQVSKFGASSIERLGKYGSETYFNYEKTPNIKRKVLTMNSRPADGKGFYYMVVNFYDEKQLLVFECTEMFMANVLKISNNFILEKDFK